MEIDRFYQWEEEDARAECMADDDAFGEMSDDGTIVGDEENAALSTGKPAEDDNSVPDSTGITILEEAMDIVDIISTDGEGSDDEGCTSDERFTTKEGISDDRGISDDGGISGRRKLLPRR